MIETVAVRQAQAFDAPVVQDMLEEAARWVDALGEVLWEEGELAPGRVDGEIAAGQFFIAEVSGHPAGAMKFQLDDRLFWPDLIDDDSAFIHRLVVRRRYKGSGVSTALIQWAVSPCHDAGETISAPGLRRVAAEAAPAVRGTRLPVPQLSTGGRLLRRALPIPARAAGNPVRRP